MSSSKSFLLVTLLLDYLRSCCLCPCRVASICSTRRAFDGHLNLHQLKWQNLRVLLRLGCLLWYKTYFIDGWFCFLFTLGSLRFSKKFNDTKVKNPAFQVCVMILSPSKFIGWNSFRNGTSVSWYICPDSLPVKSVMHLKVVLLRTAIQILCLPFKIGIFQRSSASTLD